MQAWHESWTDLCARNYTIALYCCHRSCTATRSSSLAIALLFAWSLLASLCPRTDRFYTGEPVLKFGFGLSELRHSVQPMRHRAFGSCAHSCVLRLHVIQLCAIGCVHCIFGVVDDHLTESFARIAGKVCCRLHPSCRQPGCWTSHQLHRLREKANF